MLFEDDPAVRSLLKTLLELEGFQVFSNGQVSEEGFLERLRKVRPDILVLDVRLGSLDGLQLLRRIRQEPGAQALPVLMMSGEAVESECLACGADGFLLKPYMPDDLIAWLRKLED